MEKVEKTVPSAEEKEEEGEEMKEEEKEGKDEAGGDKEKEDGDDEEQEGRDETEKKEEAVPQASDTVEKTIPLPVQLPKKEKKQNEGLNLNNEVVRMRKEVKRVRALVIRKLTRQMSALKKKKGSDVEIERNQRRAGRLLDEIHAMKVLSPDLVTKTALQKNLNFEQVCKNPKSTISDRATARIATHPQFNKKIENIKAAVQAFKAERMNSGKQRGKEKVQNKAGKVIPQSPDKKGEGKSEKEEDIPGKQKEIVENEERDGILKDTKDATTAEPEKETVKASPSAEDADGQRKAMSPESKNVRPALLKSSEGKDSVKNKPQSKGAEKKPALMSAPEVLEKKKAEEESDLESSDDDDEEKEYFDDSTEERFNKQSSQSEESDDDGFFVGKVSKYKKKKQKSVEEKEEKADKGREVTSSDQVQSELDELESRLKSKATSLQSVFCSSLSKAGGGRGAGRGRGGDRFRGQGTPRGGSGQNRDFSKQSKFQKQEKGTERNSESKYSKPCPEGRHPGSFPSVGRGRGRGRGDGVRQNDRRGGGVFSQQAPQQALHPSWEASKKRKEQQGQILAFQGKKIKFDDDD